MTHYLRYGDKSLVDIEATKDDINCVVDIKTYTDYLLAETEENTLPRHEFIEDFAAIQEIRGEYFEGKSVGLNIPDDPNELAKERLRNLAAKWRLDYITD